MGTANSDAASNSRVTMDDLIVWDQLLDPNVIQDAIEKLSSRDVDWRNKNMVILV